MEAKEFALQLKLDIEELKKGGTESVTSDSLIQYLDERIRGFESSQTSLSATDLERYRVTLQDWLEQRKSGHVHSVEMFKSVIAAGQSALKTSFLMNGGASLALLAFVGHLSSHNSGKIPLLAPSLAIFVAGVLVISLASGVTYLSQWFYADDQRWAERTGFALNVLAIVLGLASYCVFAWGVYKAYQVFASFAV
jgi:hypothetical protein